MSDAIFREAQDEQGIYDEGSGRHMEAPSMNMRTIDPQTSHHLDVLRAVYWYWHPRIGFAYCDVATDMAVYTFIKEHQTTPGRNGCE